MYCENCGAEVQEGANFCPNCGCSFTDGERGNSVLVNRPFAGTRSRDVENKIALYEAELAHAGRDFRILAIGLSIGIGITVAYMYAALFRDSSAMPFVVWLAAGIAAYTMFGKQIKIRTEKEKQSIEAKIAALKGEEDV